MPGLETSLRGVLEPRSTNALAKALDLHTVGDLLRHYPRRYVERGELTDLRSLRIGEHVTVVAEVADVRQRKMHRRKGSLVEVTVTDGTGALSLTFFNQHWRKDQLRQGRRGLFAGKVSQYDGKRQLTHPRFELFDDQDDAALADDLAHRLIGVYPAAADVTSWAIARAVRTVLDVLDPPADPLPGEVRARHGLPGLDEALRQIHRPTSLPALRRARERLKWDEAIVLQAALARRRVAATTSPARPRRQVPDGLLAAFDARLPFALTAGQRSVGEVLAAELAAAHPMHRLLQGEVGSGKTVVALRAMLTVIDSGGQAALLAPTEVLAQQHARSLRALLGPLATAGELGAPELATRVTLLTGSLGAAARRRALADIASGAAGLVVGTHALLEEGVVFADLGLVVVDEQHRFGVEQRDALRAKGPASRQPGAAEVVREPPHLLVMTATPIPRTVAMTVYGDLETSVLAELPAGRRPVRSFVVPADNPSWTARIWARVRDEVAADRQAYVVCPRIGAEPSDEDVAPVVDDGEPRAPAAAVLDVAPLLADGELAGLRVGVLHGRLPSEDKDAVMQAFAAGRLDVLVATTVIEVGVDVPTATVMVVCDADRFGVSQLHQLRGRVGRGETEGWCLLQTSAPEGSPARQRLAAVAQTNDGFAVARLDLEQRREGDVLGVAQSGRRSGLRLLALLTDEELIAAARAEASRIVTADPELRASPVLAAAIDAMLAPEDAAYLEKA